MNFLSFETPFRQVRQTTLGARLLYFALANPESPEHIHTSLAPVTLLLRAENRRLSRTVCVHVGHFLRGRFSTLKRIARPHGHARGVWGTQRPPKTSSHVLYLALLAEV